MDPAGQVIHLFFMNNIKRLPLGALTFFSFGCATAAAITPPLPSIGFDNTSDAKNQGHGHDNSNKYGIHCSFFPIRT